MNDPETTENGGTAPSAHPATESGEQADSPEYREARVVDEPADPAAAPESEGIPDLQDGTPEAQRAEDPQRMPVPGERPVAADKFGTTAAEQAEGESLDDRLEEEVPDVGPGGAEGDPTPQAGQLSDDPLPGGRPADQDTFATASDAEGVPEEESAVHVSSDDDEDLGLNLGENDT